MRGKKKKMVVVCKRFFSAVFDVTKKRIEVLTNVLFKGHVPCEKRGGDRKSHLSLSKKESLRKFLKALPASESHYDRAKCKRIYINSEYNITKLINIYNDSVAENLKVSRTMFYNIFTTEFNIGFSQPASDACSVCILWQNKVKFEKDPIKKQFLRTELRVHKLRANAFYEHLKTAEPNSLSLCFDLQQVQPLPRTPIQDAFYARQLGLYNFCVVPLDSKSPTFFTWDESQSGRGCTEIGSALYTYLLSLASCISSDIYTLRLFCDGCGGQNKNSHLLHILIFYLINNAPSHLTKIKIIFPVRGHSFLPADRVFGRVEKDIRKQPILTTKKEYYKIFKKHGNLKVLGTDWKIMDIKKLEENYRKLKNIQSYKRLTLSKEKLRGNCLVKCFENYRFEFGSEHAVSLLKKGKSNPKFLQGINSASKPLNPNKKKDINNLLTKQFGEKWYNLPELIFYKNLNVHEDGLDMYEELIGNDMDNECICLEHDIGEIKI